MRATEAHQAAEVLTSFELSILIGLMFGKSHEDSCQLFLVYLAIAVWVTALHDHPFEILDVFSFWRLQGYQVSSRQEWVRLGKKGCKSHLAEKIHKIFDKTLKFFILDNSVAILARSSVDFS